MYWSPTQTLSDKFSSIIEGIMRALATPGRGSRLLGPLGMLLHKRLGRTRQRFMELVAKVRDGVLPAVAAVRQRVGSARKDSAARAVSPWPRQFGWVQRSLAEPWHVNHWRTLLEGLLDDPELVAVIAAAPQIGRELRPLCHMLAIKPPPGLALPKRKRKPRVEKPIPANETDEQADKRVARMSERAFINMLTPETEFLKGRPPHRIGYGRSGLRLRKS